MSEPARPPERIVVLGMRAVITISAAFSLGSMIGAVGGAIGAIVCTLPIAGLIFLHIRRAVIEASAVV